MSTIVKERFGTTKNEEPVFSYILTNKNGMQVELLSYGCIIKNILVPDCSGVLQDVVLGFDSFEEYEADNSCFGAFVGRYAGRIKDASFSINGKVYFLEKNDGNHHLHGCLKAKNYESRVEDDHVIFSGVSPHMEDGFPGTITFQVDYSLKEDNSLVIVYNATTDQDTVLNFTNHSYFNLNGQDGSDITNHLLQLNSSEFAELDDENICTGKILPTKNTPLDFSKPSALDVVKSKEYPQISVRQGIDHNFIIKQTESLLDSSFFGTLYSPKTGIVLNCFSTQPAVQVYSSNHLAGLVGKHGTSYPLHGGLCLETQHYPCSPNYDSFPTTLLKSGEKFKEKTIYQFNLR